MRDRAQRLGREVRRRWPQRRALTRVQPTVIVVLVEAAALWQVLGDQVALMFGGAGAVVHRQRSWFAVLTGETSAEMNIAGLAATATAGDAGRLVAAIDAVGDGAIVAVSEQLADHATAPLAAAGFSRVGTPDALMVRPAGPPAAISTCAYEIRRAGAEDVRRAEPVVVAAHGLEVGVIDRAFNLDALARGQLGAWAAWDGDVPVSVAWLTLEPPLPGVWEVMTHPAYRRRGAARAILTRAMADAADVALAGFFLWSTPAGRPLYDALGFTVLEEVAAWARGFTDDELALLEAAPAPELA